MPIEGLAMVPQVGAWAEEQVVSLSGETRKRDLPQSYTTAAHLRIGTYVFFCQLLLCISHLLFIVPIFLQGLEGYSRDPGFDQNTVRESGKR